MNAFDFIQKAEAIGFALRDLTEQVATIDLQNIPAEDYNYFLEMVAAARDAYGSFVDPDLDGVDDLITQRDMEG